MPKKFSIKKKSLPRTRRPRVLMAMSGGVDSSVAAALLVKAGYDVTGAYMINYQAPLSELRLTSSVVSTGHSAATPCWVPDYRDALRVAAKLEIPLLKLDFTKEYKEKVLDYMFAEYQAGRTPNPDVLCNKYIKFGVWMEKAKELGFDFLATGHYARLKPGISNFQFPISQSKKTNKSEIARYKLIQAADKNKDQTYFLHQLNQEQLSRTLFPIGNYTKEQVRKLAEKFDLPTATKAESMGICFVGEVPMDEFLKTRIKPKPGNIVFSDGTIIGIHQGLPFYTIGQRHIGINCHPEPIRFVQDKLREGSKLSKRLDSSASPQNDNNKPLYVIDKRIKTNELVVGYENDPLLYKKEAIVTQMHWISGFIHRSSESEDGFIRRSSKSEGGQVTRLPLQCLVRLRHRQPLVKCTVKKSGNEIIIHFALPERAVTPGQFAVFYKNNECLGGGVIA